MDGWKNSTQHSLQICPYSFIFNHFSICCLSNVLVLFREYFLPELQYNVGSSIQTRQKHVELSSAYYYQRYAADAGGPFQRMLQLVFHGRSTWNSPAHTTTSVPRQLDAAQQFNQLIILVVYSTNRILNSISNTTTPNLPNFSMEKSLWSKRVHSEFQFHFFHVHFYSIDSRKIFVKFFILRVYCKTVPGFQGYRLLRRIYVHN